MITEEWRKIPDLPPMYEVSSWGQVRSFGPLAKGRTLKLRTHRFTGFPQVKLYEGKKHYWRYVHLLVAAAFPEEES
ncbi:NUMOD4 domain-containing protein [Streptomyces sp. NPDC048484]|uniref:NUMOD4 domain-containing protein n=1 Tax=Streptomyces sp. NPDC048484 TaxID=3155146 RepID=UPI00343F1FD2